ncbi:MAG: peptidoglycan-binding protein [Candidatus Eremiobacteraeota bacterium]|nr:peptidoglycan-binding protein [Candidatus Eremiobacteraeota bacterium]
MFADTHTKKMNPRYFLFIILFFVFSIFQVSCFTIKNPATFSAQKLKEAVIKKNVTGKIDINAKYLPGNKIEISWKTDLPDRIRKISIYRSSTNLGDITLDKITYPITIFDINPDPDINSFTDNRTAHNTKYFYMLSVQTESGRIYHSSVVSCKTANKSIPPLKSPHILIDKVNYFLEIVDVGKEIKRYPMALGRNPLKRKLNQDNQTTPEGIFRITNLQSNVPQFYKAYDLNYPTDIDKFRYRFALANGIIKKRNGVHPGIGGEIQIHSGPNIEFNWTFGCATIRKADIDELFSIRKIGSGTKVIIVGRNIDREDLKVIYKKRSNKEIKEVQKKLKKAGFDPGVIDGVPGNRTRDALGRFQLKMNLPLTCQLDSRTAKEIEKIQISDTQ